MPHPAQIRDAAQDYIERQDRPVRSWHIQDEIANRLDTRHALVYTALMQLEREGKVCKHVSLESGAEFWFSPSSETFCAACGQLALPGVHTQPESHAESSSCVPRVRCRTPVKRPNPLAKAPFQCERVP